MVMYKGIKLIHNKKSISMIKKVVSDFDPEIIMEIGTAHGGLTMVFHEACPKAVIHTYDPYKKGGNRKLFGHNVHFHIQDAFKSDLYNICKRKEKKFLFCDGFDKKKEILTFGPLLNSGDMLGCHDYPSRLWKDWKRGKKPKNIEHVIDPVIEEFLKDYEPHEANKLFEEKQGNREVFKYIYSTNYSDRYWIKK